MRGSVAGPGSITLWSHCCGADAEIQLHSSEAGQTPRIRNAPGFSPLKAGELVPVPHPHCPGSSNGQSWGTPPMPVQARWAAHSCHMARPLGSARVWSSITEIKRGFLTSLTFCKDQDCYRSICSLGLNLYLLIQKTKKPQTTGYFFPALSSKSTH